MYDRYGNVRPGTQAIGLLILGLVALGVVFLLRGLDPIHWFIYGIYANPIGFILFLAAAVLFAFAAYWGEDGLGLAWLAGLVTIFWLLWSLVFAGPVSMVGLYQKTRYQPTDRLIPVSEARDVAYAEALTNFKNQNPEARFGPGDLDYVRGKWVAEFGPATFWNNLTADSQGFFRYNPESLDKVEVVRETFPFAESGWLWNSEHFYVHQKDPFVEIHEMLYIEDPGNEGSRLIVMSLIKRSGWRRVPYISSVIVVHPDGAYEKLSPARAETDPRLEGIQLTPEWLEAKRVEAYGWRYGTFPGLFGKKGRVQVQRSEINTENSAPYHLETVSGMVWYTPYGPLGKESQKGVMMQDSHDLDSPVLVWELPGDQAYQGLDALATQIKAAPGHPADINWLRVSSTGDGKVKSGDTDIIELIPLSRLENDGQVHLYYMGYVAIDPPTATRFYVLINAETREVLRDSYSVADVNDWLWGRIELPVQTTGAAPIPTISIPAAEIDVTQLSDEQLLKLLRYIVEELERRRQ